MKRVCVITAKIVALLACAVLFGCSKKLSNLEAQYLLHCADTVQLTSSVKHACDSVSLPDNSGAIYSSMEQGLSVFVESRQRNAVLYNTNSSNDMSTNQAIWGDLTCTEPDRFVPTTIDLWQRHSGRWQLAAINNNHAQTIEFFELEQLAENISNEKSVQTWTLAWRGCVYVEQDVTLKNISLDHTGIRANAVSSPTTFLKKWLIQDDDKTTLTRWYWRVDRGWTITSE